MPSDPDIEGLLNQAEGLRALARSLVLDQHDVDDLIQDAWLVALERRPDLLASPRGWMARVLRNLAFQLARKRGRQREVRLAAEALPGGDLEGFSLERLEVHRQLVDMVEALAEPYRGLVMLRYFEGLTPREIAQRLGEKPARIRNRLSRALAQLREGLDRKDAGRRGWVVALIPLCLGEARRGVSRLPAILTAMALVAVSVIGFVWNAGVSDPVLTGMDTAEKEVLPRRADLPAPPPSREATVATRPGAPPVPAFPTRKLLGRVVDLEGRPLAGARVAFVVRPDPEGSAARDVIPGVFREPRPIASTTVRSDGGFVLNPPASARGWVVVRAEGYGTKAAAVDDEPESGLFFALPPERTVEAIVLDGNGTPVPDVSLRVATPLNDGGDALMQRTRTGIDGSARWRLDRLGERDLRALVLERITGGLQASRQEVTLEKKGFAPRRVSLTRGRRRDERGRLVFRLTRGRALTMVFTSSAGVPIHHSIDVVLRMLGGDFIAHVASDERGRLRLSDLPEGDDLWLLVDGNDGRPAEVVGGRLSGDYGLSGVSIAIPTEGNVSLTVRLGAGKSLALRLVDAETGALLAHVPVLCIPQGAFLGLKTQARKEVTDRRGQVAFTGLVDRPHLVLLDDERWSFQQAGVPDEAPPGGRILHPGEKGAVMHVLPAMRRGRVAGRLLGDDGLPLAGVPIRLSECEPRTERWPAMTFLPTVRPKTTTSQDGRFDLAGLPTGVPVRLVADPSSPLTRTVSPPFTLAPGEVRSGEILRARRGADLVLALQDEEGRAIAGVGVTLSIASPEGRGSLRAFRHARSDGGGEVRFSGLADGRYRTSFEDLRDRGFVVERRFRPTIEIEEGRSLRRTVLLESAVSMSLVLLDDRGRPLKHRLAMAIPNTIDADDRRRVGDVISHASEGPTGGMTDLLAHILGAEAARTNGRGRVEFRVPADRVYRIVVLDAVDGKGVLVAEELAQPGDSPSPRTLRLSSTVATLPSVGGILKLNH